MRLRDIHFWTAIAVVGVCGFAAFSGWSIVRFSLATINVAKKPAEARAWTGVPGVAATAWHVELRDKVNSSDVTAANARREALSAFLSIKPLSPYYWLVLSGMEFVTAQPMEDVLDPLTLSALTGPNEGYVMAERGIFGLSLWEDLPPDLKRRAAMDLAAEEVIIKQNEKIRAVLSTKPVGVRDEVRTALLAAGLSAEDIERLGL